MTIQGALPQNVTLCITIPATAAINYGRAIDFLGGQSQTSTRPLGVVQSTVAIGDSAAVAVDGIVEVELFGACSPGDPLVAGGSGLFLPASAGQYIMLRALGVGVAGGRVLAIFSREGNLN